MDPSHIKALTFDVGGTILDWHDTIAGRLRELGTARSMDTDWAALANAWRQRAAKLVIDSRTADIPSGSMDGANRVTLDEVLREKGLTGFSREDKEELCRAWHTIPPWPDVPKGIKRLQEQFIVSTMTILSTAGMIRTAKLGGIRWDCIISCEMFEHYKFHPAAYERTAELLGCAPAEVMMVAAHYHDLEAAGKVGFRTAFLDRPMEFGPDSELTAQAAAHGTFEADLVVHNLEELADRLGL